MGLALRPKSGQFNQLIVGRFAPVEDLFHFGLFGRDFRAHFAAAREVALVQRKRPVGCIIPKTTGASKNVGMNEDVEAKREAALPKYLRVSEAERAEWVRRFQESNLSIRKFSAQNGLCHISVWRWVNRARGEAKPAESSAVPAFTEIKLAPPLERSDWVAELSLPGGKVLRFSKDVPAAMLEQLLRVC